MIKSTTLRSIICALAVSVFHQTHAAQQFVIRGEKTWDGPYKFTADVGRQSNNTGRILFQANPVPELYDLHTNNQAFPTLDLNNTSSCQSFKSCLESFIQQMTIANRTHKYKARLPDGRMRAIQLKPQNQNPLACQLFSCDLTPNDSTGKLEARISVLVGDPVHHIILDITHKIPNIPAILLPFTETQGTQDGSVVCVNGEGLVFLASGATRKYRIPAIPGTNLTQQEEKIVANYQPTLSAYKDAFFATFFPKNPQPVVEEILESCSDSEDDFSRENSFSDMSSITDSEWEPSSSVDRQRSVFNPYKFYKIEGSPVEIPAEKNPFMILDKNGQSYYTRAFQVTCYPMIEGVVNRNQGFILQWFVKTSIRGTNHNWPTDEFGLRWGIYDQDGFPIEAEPCKNQRLPKSCLKMNLLTLREKWENYPPAAEYILKSPSPGTGNNAFISELKSVFNRGSQHIIFNVLNQIYSNTYYTVFTEILSGTTTGQPVLIEQPRPAFSFIRTKPTYCNVEKLEFIVNELDSKCHYPDKFFCQAIQNLSRLKYFKYAGDSSFFYKIMGTGCMEDINPFPDSLEELEFSQTSWYNRGGFDASVLNCPSTYTSTVIGEISMKLSAFPLRKLRKLSISTEGKTCFSNFSQLGEMLGKHPHLNELYISSRFVAANWADQPGTRQCSNPGNEWIYSHDPHSKFETMYSAVRDYFGPKILGSGLGVVHFRLPQLYNPPKGSNIVSNGDGTITVTSTPQHRQWTHLMTLIEQLKEKPGLQVIVNG